MLLNASLCRAELNFALAALSPGLWFAPLQFILPAPPPGGPHLTLADLEGVFLALLQPGRSPWVVNPGSGTAQRSLFALTLTTAGTPAKRDGTWWGRGMCEPPHLPPHRGVQGPRPQVSRLAHPLVSEDFMVIKPLHCEPPHLRTAFCRYLGKRT